MDLANLPLLPIWIIGSAFVLGIAAKLENVVQKRKGARPVRQAWNRRSTDRQDALPST